MRINKKYRYMAARPFEKLGTKCDIKAFKINGKNSKYFGKLGGLLWSIANFIAGEHKNYRDKTIWKPKR